MATVPCWYLFIALSRGGLSSRRAGRRCREREALRSRVSGGGLRLRSCTGEEDRLRASGEADRRRGDGLLRS